VKFFPVAAEVKRLKKKTKGGRSKLETSHVVSLKFRRVATPEFPLKFHRCRRFIDDQGQQLGQRRVEIVQPEFLRAPARRRGNGQRGGPAERLDQQRGSLSDLENSTLYNSIWRVFILSETFMMVF
jgi:hypothetical protein